MNCKNCGAPLSANEKFCGNCGAKSSLRETVICKSCGKEFVRDFGICPECGSQYEEEASAEIEDGADTELMPIDLRTDPTLSEIPPVKILNREEEEPESKESEGENLNDIISKNEFESDSENKEEPEKPNAVGVRAAMLEYIKTKPYAGFLQASALLLLVYPVMFLLSIILKDTKFYSVFYKSEFLLKLISFFGIFLCLARRQSDVMALSSGIMAISCIVKAYQGSFAFNSVVKILFYLIACIAFIREFITSGEEEIPVYKSSSETSKPQVNNSPLKWIVIGIFIALGILGIILLCSGKVCDYCGKYVFEYSEIMGEIICKDCFYS